MIWRREQDHQEQRVPHVCGFGTIGASFFTSFDSSHAWTYTRFITDPPASITISHPLSISFTRLQKLAFLNVLLASETCLQIEPWDPPPAEEGARSSLWAVAKADAHQATARRSDPEGDTAQSHPVVKGFPCVSAPQNWYQCFASHG